MSSRSILRSSSGSRGGGFLLRSVASKRLAGCDQACSPRCWMSVSSTSAVVSTTQIARARGGGEGCLHPCVGGDDRPAQIGIRPQVVERLVEGCGEGLGSGFARGLLVAAEEPGGDDRAGQEEQPENDGELVPAEAERAAG